MKMKSFAMLAISGLLASTVAYIAPAMADYTNSANPAISTPNPADNTTNQNLQDPNANVGGMSQNSKRNYEPAQNNTITNDNTPTEQGTPDTATGDDDY